MEKTTTCGRNSICRICMQGNTNLYSIFDKVKFGNNTNTIAEIINECTKHAVVSNDKLPTKICNICMTLAYSAHTFKRQTELAYCRLKDLYGMSLEAVIGKGAQTSLGDRYTQTEKKDGYPCASCPKKFNTEDDLQQHRSTTHVFDGKKCWVCYEKFNHWSQLKIHLSNKHPNEGIRCDFKCYVCQRGFGRKSHLKRHLVEVHKIQNPNCDLKCQICLTGFSRKDQLKRHLMQEHNIEDTALNISNLFPDVTEIQLAGDQNYEDAEGFGARYVTNHFICGDQDPTDHRGFNDINEDLNQFTGDLAHPEILIKTENPEWDDNDPPYKKRKSDGDQVEDVQKVGSNDECFEPNALEEVVKNYNFESSNGQRNEHNDGATGREMTKEAKRCDTFFSAIQNKTLSQLTSKREDNCCRECNRCFSRISHLRRHMLTHNMQKTYKCNICGDSFPRYDEMQNHVQSKHGKKKVHCKYCDCDFEHRGHLLRHIERRHKTNHKAAKPLIDCDMCEKIFTTKGSLERHKLLHADRCDFKCHLCPKGYTRKDHLKRHLVSRHKV